jgi:hypothetical protein
MKIQIHVLHIRDRWGGNSITGHYTSKQMMTALAKFMLSQPDDADNLREAMRLIRVGKIPKAAQFISEASETAGHEWTDQTIGIDPAKAELFVRPKRK